MNGRDEQHVIEAIRASTGRLRVTEHDIITAYVRLEKGLDAPTPRRRRLALAAVAAIVLAVGAVSVMTADPGDGDAAPPAGTPTSAADALVAALQSDAYILPAEMFSAGTRPTAEDLAGFWLLRPPYGFTMLVDGDGGWSMGAPGERIGSGTSTLAGDTWTRRLGERGGCAAASGLDFSERWRATLAEDDSLRLQLTTGQNLCTSADEREVWDRVAPGSPVAAYLDAVLRHVDWRPAFSNFTWQGIYVAPETGNVLEVGDDGRYRYHDTVSGTQLAVADQGRLEATGDTMSGSCDGGGFAGSLEVGQVPGVSEYVHGYPVLRITATMDTCASGIAQQELWVDVTPSQWATGAAFRTRRPPE